MSDISCCQTESYISEVEPRVVNREGERQHLVRSHDGQVDAALLLLVVFGSVCLCSYSSDTIFAEFHQKTCSNQQEWTCSTEAICLENQRTSIGVQNHLRRRADFHFADVHTYAFTCSKRTHDLVPQALYFCLRTTQTLVNSRSFSVTMTGIRQCKG